MIKKRIYSLIAALALLCVLSACFPEPEPEPEPEEAPPEKYYYTLRLVNDNSDTIGISVGGDSYGTSRNGTSRALTNDVAQAFHDFFEVVFFYNGPGGPVVARTTWNVGETPELSGVYGKGNTHSAVNYATIRQPATTAGVGSAVLFAGVKKDKTLLAVGKLSHVDNQPGTTITPNTTAVTFEVAALRAGAVPRHEDRTDSSFLTAYTGGTTVSVANTTIIPATTDALPGNRFFIHYVDKKPFPLYRVRSANTTNAEYTFKLVTGDFNDYSQDNGGIILAGGWNCEIRQPRYILADGFYQTSSIFTQAVKQGTTELITMNANNKRAPEYLPVGPVAYFQNPVGFVFNTANQPDGSIFALAFEIYVYNLTYRPTTLAGSLDSQPVKWRISTGIGTKWLDLDDGSGGEGGAILLGFGDVTSRLTPYNNWN